MKSWLISVTAIILFTSCAEILLPSGKIKNSCRTVLAMICMAVIISPIGELFNFKTDFSDIFQYDIVDQEYVESTEEYYCSIFEKQVVSLLKEKGVDCIDCEVEGSLEEGKFSAQKVCVKIKKSVITGEDEHIISIVEIKSMLSDALVISENKVEVYEQ